MKWIKRGKIFDPTSIKLPNECMEFAQSPQTLEFEDYIRIYFSTRKIDGSNGKYLSHVAYVDFEKDFGQIVIVSNSP